MKKIIPICVAAALSTSMLFNIPYSVNERLSEASITASAADETAYD